MPLSSMGAFGWHARGTGNSFAVFNFGFVLLAEVISPWLTEGFAMTIQHPAPAKPLCGRMTAVTAFSPQAPQQSLFPLPSPKTTPIENYSRQASR